MVGRSFVVAILTVTFCHIHITICMLKPFRFHIVFFLLNFLIVKKYHCLGSLSSQLLYEYYITLNDPNTHTVCNKPHVESSYSSSALYFFFVCCCSYFCFIHVAFYSYNLWVLMLEFSEWSVHSHFFFTFI